MKKYTLYLLILIFVSCNSDDDSIPSTSSFFLAGTEIYVSDAAGFSFGNYKILKFNPFTEEISTFINTNLDWPQDIVFLEDRNEVIISNLNSNKITKYNINDGSFIGDFASGLNGPTRMKIGPDNLLYVAQWNGNNPILRFNLDGSFVDEFSSIGLGNAIGMDWDKDNNLYISQFNSSKIRKFDSNGELIGDFTNNSKIKGPTNIWFNEIGNLNLIDWQSDKILQFSPSGEFIIELITSGLLNPEGVLELENGAFLIGNGVGSSVKLYNANGTFIKDVIKPKSGGLITPNAVVARINN